MSNEDNRYIVQQEGSDVHTVYQSLHFSLWGIIEQVRLVAAKKLSGIELTEIEHDFGLNKIDKESLLEIFNSEEMNHAFYDTAFLKMYTHFNHRKKYDLILANKINFFIYEEIAFLMGKVDSLIR